MTNYSTIEQLYELYLKANQQVCTDTRRLVKDGIFFALKGDTFNANTFATEAIEKGCAYAVVDEANYANGKNIVLVENVLKALQALANHHRHQFKIPFIAITGSNGKTTNKELIHTVLSKKYKALATEGNLNNHIGVPLTLLKVNAQHEIAIIEMGANHQGEINELCGIADPDFGMITNIGKAHLEGFGGIEGVKKGKSEMYRYLQKKDAPVFVNGDDDVLQELAIPNDKITYGTTKLFDVIGKQKIEGDCVTLQFTTRYGEKKWELLPIIKTQITGHYNFINCLAAACIGNYFKVEANDIKIALENYVPEMNRSQLKQTANNTLLLDAYNANPNSMKAAIDNFQKHSANDKLLILGDMFELGQYSLAEHQTLIHLLQKYKFKDVYIVGTEFGKTEHGDYHAFENTESLKNFLKLNPPQGKTILIKGSRGMKLESVIETL
jgi:UDP-N-acetylmuramoyl-tripeptide--D-alanyl-D-alanine ligase